MIFINQMNDGEKQLKKIVDGTHLFSSILYNPFIPSSFLQKSINIHTIDLKHTNACCSHCNLFSDESRQEEKRTVQDPVAK